MRLAGEGVWGPPADPMEATRVLQRFVECGGNFIDTAVAYGPYLNEELIARVLFPYPAGLVIATKGGLMVTAPFKYETDGRPECLRAAVEGSLRRLRIDCIQLYQHHKPDPNVPYEESIGALAEMQRAGKIRHLGICNVSAAQLASARRIAPIVSVQNRYNVVDRSSDEVLGVCERDGLAFLPWAPLNKTADLSALDAVARMHEATVQQIAIAWLLQRSPVMLPIPGTGSLAHLDENLAAADIELSDAEMQRLAGSAPAQQG
jgi:pyridoxine 4-dehydrogenase